MTEAKGFNWNKDKLTTHPSDQDGSETIGLQATGLDQGLADVLRLDSALVSDLIRSPDLAILRGQGQPYDCHKQLINQVHLTCSSIGESPNQGSWNEGERAGLAIALTICSITSALQSPPAECDPWSPYALSVGTATTETRKSFPEDDQEGRVLRGRCLEALHRSPQDWSSYNGYLSDTTKLCHALRGQQVLDVAQAIYINTTHEKVALIQMLKSHELVRRQSELETESGWLSKIDSFGNMLEHLSHTHLDLTSQLNNQRADAEWQTSRMEGVIKQALSQKEGFWADLESGRAALIRDVGSSLQKEVSDNGKAAVEDLSLALHRTVQDYQMSISHRDAILHETMSAYIDTIDERMIVSYEMEKHQVEDTKLRWEALSGAAQLAESGLIALVERVAEIEPTLQHTLQTAIAINKYNSIAYQGIQAQTGRLKGIMTDHADLAMKGKEAWTELKDDLAEERTELQNRRKKGWTSSLGGVAGGLGDVMLPGLLSVPMIQLLVSVIGRYPSGWIIIKTLWSCLSVLVEGVGFTFWFATWTYVMVKTGLWRLFRAAAKTMYHLYVESQDGERTPFAPEEGIAKDNLRGLTFAKHPLVTILEDPVASKRHHLSVTSGLPQQVQPVRESRGSPPSSRTRYKARVVSAPETWRIEREFAREPMRRKSLSATVDQLRRRAQSEPLF